MTRPPSTKPNTVSVPRKSRSAQPSSPRPQYRSPWTTRLAWAVGSVVAGGCVSTQEDTEPVVPLGGSQTAHPASFETVAEQEILTPIPMRLRVSHPLAADFALVYYRTFGTREWSLLELGRFGESWTGAVPCLEVGTITGPLQLFVHVHDHRGRLLAALGSPHAPYIVPVHHRLPYGPSGLLDSSVPARCADPADCPPDFPGCPARHFLRPPCKSERECAAGERCAWDGYCDPVKPALPRVTMPWER